MKKILMCLLGGLLILTSGCSKKQEEVKVKTSEEIINEFFENYIEGKYEPALDYCGVGSVAYEKIDNLSKDQKYINVANELVGENTEFIKQLVNNQYFCKYIDLIYDTSMNKEYIIQEVNEIDSTHLVCTIELSTINYEELQENIISSYESLLNEFMESNQDTINTFDDPNALVLFFEEYGDQLCITYKNIIDIKGQYIKQITTVEMINNNDQWYITSLENQELNILEPIQLAIEQYNASISNESKTPDTNNQETVEETSSGFTDSELASMVFNIYQNYPNVRVSIEGEEDGIVTIHAYEDMENHTATFDWYYIDRKTGKGTNFMGETVDLTNTPVYPAPSNNTSQSNLVGSYYMQGIALDINADGTWYGEVTTYLTDYTDSGEYEIVDDHTIKLIGSGSFGDAYQGSGNESDYYLTDAYGEYELFDAYAPSRIIYLYH